MPSASTLTIHAKAMAKIMSPEERCVRLDAEITSLRAQLDEARHKAISDCIEVVQGRVEHYRTLASTTGDFELADKREYGAEACEWLAFYLSNLLSESKT